MLQDSGEKNKKLNLLDITSMKLANNRMVVLNSCNTGKRAFINGEGILSLGWAFKYVECPSILLNLKEVDDPFANRIMNSYYRNLKKGLSKSKALQIAKIRYLNEAIPFKTNPKYWSGINNRQ